VSKVAIEREHLEELLWYAKRSSRWRSWRTLWRWRPACAGDEREPDCFSCQAFTAAEEALKGDA